MKLLNDERTRIYEYECRLYHNTRKVKFVFDSDKKEWSLVSEGPNYMENILKEVLETLEKLNKDNSE